MSQPDFSKSQNRADSYSCTQQEKGRGPDYFKDDFHIQCFRFVKIMLNLNNFKKID